jgi:hypothetical protein
MMGKRPAQQEISDLGKENDKKVERKSDCWKAGEIAS